MRTTQMLYTPQEVIEEIITRAKEDGFEPTNEAASVISETNAEGMQATVAAHLLDMYADKAALANVMGHLAMVSSETGVFDIAKDALVPRQDATGHTVTINAEEQRMVSLYPQAFEDQTNLLVFTNQGHHTPIRVSDNAIYAIMLLGEGMLEDRHSNTKGFFESMRQETD